MDDEGEEGDEFRSSTVQTTNCAIAMLVAAEEQKRNSGTEGVGGKGMPDSGPLFDRNSEC